MNNDPRSSHNHFCLPFFEARAKMAEAPEYYEEVLDCFKDLIPLVEKASFFRIEGLEISSNQSLFQDASLSDISPTCKSEVLSQDKDQPRLVKDFFAHEITQWYKTLVKTGNQVFLAEYLLRDFDEQVANY